MLGLGDRPVVPQGCGRLGAGGGNKATVNDGR